MTTFHAIETRDNIAQQYDGQVAVTVEHYRDDLYEVSFTDGEIILATAADLKI